MYGLRLLSETVPKVSGKIFSRKYTMLGRLVTRWHDIVGADLADKTQPAKIRYMKGKNKGKPVLTLDIAAASANATVLHYQKDLILERINQIFGENWITGIRFVPMATGTKNKKTKIPPKPLTGEEKTALSGMLESVQDEDMQKRLESLGAAILQDKSMNREI